MKKIYTVIAVFMVTLFVASCERDKPDPSDLSNSLVGWAVGTSSADGYGSILKTIDGGATWARQGDAATFANINFDAVYPYDEKTVIVGGYSTKNDIVIVKSTDGGQTWRQKGQNLGKGAIYGLTLVARNQLMGCGNVSENDVMMPAIFQSFDNGDTWQTVYVDRQAEGSFMESMVADVAGNVVALGGGSNGGISLCSSDYGRSWSKGTIGPQANVGGVIDVSALPSLSIILAAGTEEALSINKSTDKGKTWRQVYKHDDLHMNGIHVISENNIWVAADDMLIYHSTDGGETWKLRKMDENSEGLSTQLLMGVRFLKNEKVGCMCGIIRQQDLELGLMIRTTDGGENWSKVEIPFCGMLHRIMFVSTNSHK